MKSRKIMIIVASIAVLLSIGGCTVKHKEMIQNKENDCCFIYERPKGR